MACILVTLARVGPSDRSAGIARISAALWFDRHLARLGQGARPGCHGGLEAEVRAILERAAQEAVGADDVGERFRDWFVRMTRPGIDLDAAIAENRSPHEGVKL